MFQTSIHLAAKTVKSGETLKVTTGVMQLVNEERQPSPTEMNTDVEQRYSPSLPFIPLPFNPPLGGYSATNPLFGSRV